jgi:hypothetical protein
LQKELETMRNAGIGGVEIQPVYPLMLDDKSKGIKNLPYLSPEFLDAVNFANRTAQSMGMRVDITLGSGWPYGGPKTPLALSAGRLKVLSLPVTGAAFTPPPLAQGDSIIAAFAIAGTEKSFDPSTARRIDLATGAIPAGSGTPATRVKQSSARLPERKALSSTTSPAPPSTSIWPTWLRRFSMRSIRSLRMPCSLIRLRSSLPTGPPTCPPSS